MRRTSYPLGRSFRWLNLQARGPKSLSTPIIHRIRTTLTYRRDRPAKHPEKARRVPALRPVIVPWDNWLSRAKAPPADPSWWTLWPHLLADELKAFSGRGIEPRVVHKQNGILILEADWPAPGQPEPMRLRIGFSPLHPFFRPAVAAPEQNFERHQNPFSKELCLLTQETGQWNSRQLVADFIHERLQHLLSVLTARKEERWDDAAKLEEHAPDPLMPYFSGAAEADSVVIFDGNMPLPSSGHGMMEVAYTARATARQRTGFEGVLGQLTTSSGSLIRHFAFPPSSPDQRTIPGRWVKFTPPAISDPEQLLRLAEDEFAKQAVMQPASILRVNQATSAPLFVTGIIFPDETQYRDGKKGIGWLFLVTRREFQSDKSVTALVRGERASREDIFARLPIASTLLDKKVLVFGCGAIGSFVGLELARAGVGQLSFFDFDIVEPGNSLRWPLGRTAWGRSKAGALADFVAVNYPWTKTNWLDGRLGAATADPTGLPPKPSANVLSPILDAIHGADLVVDASASFEVQHALAFHCRALGVPYIMGYATVGLAGGVVARFPPDSQSCLVCLQEHWKQGSIPSPREDTAGVVTPVGCNAPNFTGGAFDLQEISLELARSAVGILSGGKYDAGDWDVAILALQNDAGKRVLPSWQPVACPPHPNCCGGAQ